MPRHAILAAAGVVLLLLGAVAASGRSTADPYVGTWHVANATGFTYDSPWEKGGTVTVTSSTRATVASYKGDPGWGGTQDLITPDCLGYPNTPNPPAVSAWYVMTYSWGGAHGTMAGCVSSATRGFAYVFGPGTYAELHADPNACRPSPCFVGYWTDQPGPTTQFWATTASPQTTETVNEPAPGEREFLTSDGLPAGSRRDRYDIQPEEAARGNMIAAIGKQVSTVGGELVAWCWLSVDFTDENGQTIPLSAQEQLYACYYAVIKALHIKKLPPASARSTRVLGAVPSTSLGEGCTEKAIPLLLRKRSGKLILAGRARKAKLTASPVRYTCSASGGVATVTITSSTSLRKALGKKLILEVYRAKKAPPASGKLTFTFGW